MRDLSPRRRRAAALGGCTAAISGGLLPAMIQLTKHSNHPGLVTMAYLAPVVVLVAYTLRELVKLQKEEGCPRA